jgi:hypothetical protein
MIVNCLAIKAEALALGGTALALFGDDAIAVIAACLAGLGVMAKLETEMDTLTFRHLCEDAYDAMAAAGEWVVDGAVTVYNCATELWDYGVDCGMVQWLHDWIFDSQVVGIEGIASNPGVTVPADALATAYAAPFAFFSYVETVSGAYKGKLSYFLCYSYESPIIAQYGDAAGNGWSIYTEDSSATAYCYATYGAWNKCTGTISGQNTSKRLLGPTWIGTEDSMDLVTSHDISLGVIAPPGTDIQTEYGEYIVIVAPNGVPDTGGDGSGDDQPKIPIIPVPVLPSYEETIRLPQEDIWKGNKVETEDPDTGGSTDPSTGTDTDDPDSGSNDPTTPTTGTDNPDSPGDDGSQDVPLTPDQLQPFVVDLRDFFPFCIPFDLYDFFQLLDADPVAPVFHREIQDLAGNVYSIDIDLSAWDSTALFFRRLQLLVFTVGLAMASRKFIKW